MGFSLGFIGDAAKKIVDVGETAITGTVNIVEDGVDLFGDGIKNSADFAGDVFETSYDMAQRGGPFGILGEGGATNIMSNLMGGGGMNIMSNLMGGGGMNIMNNLMGGVENPLEELAINDFTQSMSGLFDIIMGKEDGDSTEVTQPNSVEKNP